MNGKMKPSFRTTILAAAGVSALICILVFLFSKTPEETGREIQESFLALEKQASQEAQKVLEGTKNPTLKQEEQDVFIHQYENDSLTFWNTNKVPVPRLASLRFPSSGVVHLKNGWYYSVEKKKGNKIVVGSFLIKYKYPYENEYLSNKANPTLSDKNFTLSLDEQEGVRVVNSSKNYCFSYTLISEKKQKTSGYLLFFGGLFCLLILAFFLTIKTPIKRTLMVSAWLVLMYFTSLSGLITSDLLSPRLFAYSDVLPNLFSICLAIMAFALLLLALSKTKIAQREKGQVWKPIFLLAIWWLVEGVIPFVLKKLLLTNTGNIFNSLISFKNFFISNGTLSKMPLIKFLSLNNE